MASPNYNALAFRDMFLWTSFTPGSPTTGGTFIGSIPNPALSVMNIVSLNTTTGLISVTLPPVPATYNYWALNITATLEAISPTAIPNAETPMDITIVPNAPATYAVVAYSDADWGNFQSYTNTSQTVSTHYCGAYGAGGLGFTINTLDIATETVFFIQENRKIHFLIDAIAI